MFGIEVQAEAAEEKMEIALFSIILVTVLTAQRKDGMFWKHPIKTKTAIIIKDRKRSKSGD